MRTKLILLTLIFLATLNSLVLASTAASRPNDVLNSYLNAAQKGEYKEAYSFISSKDKTNKSLQTYLKENKKQTNLLSRSLDDKVSYKILTVEINNDTAVANVEHTAPNLDSVVPEILSALFTSVLGDKNETELEEILAKKIDNGIPVKTEEKIYNLVKEKNQWKVMLGWKTEQQLRQASDQNLIANNQAQWTSTIQIDEMTDEKIGTITSTTVKGSNIDQTPYSAIIRCKSENPLELDIVINWDTDINLSLSNIVQYRFDRDKMFEVRVTPANKGVASLVSNSLDKIKIIELMKKKKIMRVKHTASQVARFSLLGFNSAFNEACSWWKETRRT